MARKKKGIRKRGKRKASGPQMPGLPTAASGAIPTLASGQLPTMVQ